MGTALVMDSWSVDLLGERFVNHYTDRGYGELEAGSVVHGGKFVRNGTEQFDSVLHQVREPVREGRVAGVQRCVNFRPEWDPFRLGLWTLFHSWMMGEGTVAEAAEMMVGFLESVGVGRERLRVECFPGGVYELPPWHEGRRAALRWVPEENVVDGHPELTFWGVNTRGACGPSIHWCVLLEDTTQWCPVASITQLMYHRVPSEKIQSLGRQFVRTSVNGEWLQHVLNGQQHLHDGPDRLPLRRLIERTSYAMPWTGGTTQLRMAYYQLVDLLLLVVQALADGAGPEMVRPAVQCGVELCRRYFGMELEDGGVQLYMHTLAQQACAVLGIRWRKEIGESLRREEFVASKLEAMK